MFKFRITPILAATALVVAVFGSTPIGHAAGELVLGKSSVGTVQLKKNAVTTAKMRKNAVTSVKVKNGSLLAADFKAGQLPAGPQGPKGDAGVPGAQGPQGDPGVQGPKGNPGATKVTVREGHSGQAGPGTFTTAFAWCHAGETLTGGGASYSSSTFAVRTPIESRPNGNGWISKIKNDGQGGWVATGAYALCASP